MQELEDFGIVKGELREGKRYYDETEREIVRAVTELSRYGVAGATCASSSPPPSARRRCCSRSSPRRCARAIPERRKEAVEALENLAAVASHLKHLLLVRDLRKITK